MQWWTRITQLLSARNMTPADLARVAGIEPKLMYKYLEGKVLNPRGDNLKRIADALDSSEQFLRYGVAVVELKRIPLLALKDIARLRKSQRPSDVWDGVSYVAAPKDVSDQAFGVAIGGDESNTPEIGPDDIVICEPEAVKLPGKYVVVVLEKPRRALIGRYQPSRLNQTDKFKIAHDNPHYPTEEIDKKNPGFVVARATKHIRDLT